MIKKLNTKSTVFKLGLLSSMISATVSAQDENSVPDPLEEIVILGRLQSIAEDVLIERMEASVSVDVIDAETIGRIGDTTVADAVQRLPGVTLVDGKYVYIRGLGERYVNSTLNGAMVPSPDLTRNVIPLDIFPTSIVKSLKVQKAYSADQFGTFGGGSVDIRTKGIPDGPELKIELSNGSNKNSRPYYYYEGGDDDKWGEDDGTRALSSKLDSALDLYQGDLSQTSILNSPQVTSVEQAAQIRRELATELYRDIDVKKKGSTDDYGVKLSGGTAHIFENDMEIGVLAGVSYDEKWRNKSITVRNVSLPDERATFEESTTHGIDITANLSVGLSIDEDNIIETTSLFIRNTDDELALVNIFNENRPISSGTGFRDYNYEYEQRELTIHQVNGDHTINENVLEKIGLSKLNFLKGAEINWYYSDSEVSTEKPSEIVVQAETTSDPDTARILSTTVRTTPNTANYRFTDLDDYVDSYGYDFSFPIYTDNFDLHFNGGWDYWKKARIYEQLEFALGMDNVDETALPLTEGPGTVFSDDNILNEDFDFAILSRNTNSNSYIAANRLNSGYGEFDFTWSEKIRLATGVRWEDYKQATLNWNPLNYSTGQIQYPEDIGYRTETDWFFSTALTYMVQGFSENDFQLRLSFASSKIRPDIREISPSTYEDPITDLLVYGNPDVESSDVKHVDLRAEWFFSDINNLTVSLFHKEIDKPIELFGLPISDGGLAAEVENAEKGTITGIELEASYRLGDLTDSLTPFFVQSNMTLLDSELTVGEAANAPTNLKREMNGASPYSANVILGFDSDDSLHSATLSYNVFGERIYFAGRNGAEDIYEQPFSSLNFTYSFYPTESFTVKFKAKNLLDETEKYSRESDTGNEVDIIEIDRGQTFSLSVAYSF